MLSKITRSKILFIAVLLVIVPIMVSAAGNKEAGNGLTLDTEVMTLLNEVADKNVSMDDAQSGLLSLESKYQVKAATMEQFQKMLEDVNDGVRTSADCEEQVGSLVRNRMRNQDQDALMVKDQLQTGKSSDEGNPAAKKSGKN